MKRLIVMGVFLGVLLPSLAWAWGVMGMSGVNTSATCSISNHSELVAQDTGAASTGISATSWEAQRFMFTSATTITRIRLSVADVNNTGTLTVEIYSDVTETKKPGTTTGTSVSVSASSIEATQAYVNFNFSTPFSASANTPYHFVVKGSADSAFIVYNETASGGALYRDTDYGESATLNSGTDWTIYNTYDDRFYIYGCQ
jgi:hypothetical protein